MKSPLAVACVLLSLLVFLFPALAQLPAAPQSTTIQSLLSQLLTEGRNSVSPEVKERIREEVRAKRHVAPEFQLYNQAGVVLFARFCPLEALWAFTEAANRNPENPDLLNNLATVLLTLDRKDEAEKLLLYVQKRWPNYVPALLNLSILYLREGKLERAEVCLKRARNAEPGLALTERLGVQLARIRGDPAQEARSALNWSYLDPKDPESLEALHSAPHAEVVAEANRRLTALPLPRQLVNLPALEEDARTFVLSEERDHFFSKVLNHSTRKAAEPALSGAFRKEIPLEVWNSLSAKDREVMRSYGFQPATEERMLLPALEELKKARENYPFLAQVIQAYEDQFLRLAERAFK
ncbi:tetratricopeptide repeat protein [Atrimonas thermophila]|uniref:tetratricopeptide repeat protein n=1 Tax=Atrimonas thermophila TaxID=3064161 RepID=UPI00399CE164